MEECPAGLCVPQAQDSEPKVEAEDPLQGETYDIVGNEGVPSSVAILPETSHGSTGHTFVAIEE